MKENVQPEPPGEADGYNWSAEESSAGEGMGLVCSSEVPTPPVTPPAP